MSTGSIDVSAVRAAFPGLTQEQVFFDNAGGSQVLGTVVDSIREYFLSANVQLGGSYKVGKEATARYAAGYEAGRKYINAAQGELVFGSSTTQLFRNLSQTLKFNPGDELVVSSIDHEANIASWVALAERFDLVLKWWTPGSSSNPKLTPENLEPLLSDKTRLVTCTHTSNILGTIHDVKALAAAVHKRPGALICVDAVAFAPHRAIDVAELGVDFYAFSWYKVYGPHIAMLYASREAQKQMTSLGHFFNAHDTLEGKLGLAGASYELVAAIPAVLTYLGTSGDSRWSEKTGQEAALQRVLLQYLTGRSDVTIYGEPSADPTLRVPTISFRVDGWGAKELVDAVDKHGGDFGFKYGHFYSYRLLKDTLDVDPQDGVVRVSMVHYNTVDEIKSFVSTLDVVLARK